MSDEREKGFPTTSKQPSPSDQRRAEVRKALERHAKKLARRLEALRGDLAEARRADEVRRYGEALLAYAKQVPARAKVVTLSDPGDPDRQLTIALDPTVGAPANAARYFKRAAKAERGQRDIPPRITAVERELNELVGRLDRAQQSDESADGPGFEAAELDLERALAALTPGARAALHAPEPLPRRRLGLTSEEPPKPVGPKPPTTKAPPRRH